MEHRRSTALAPALDPKLRAVTRGFNASRIFPDYSKLLASVLPDYSKLVASALPDYSKLFASALPDYSKLVAAAQDEG
jgi:hypothetical protein